MNQSDTRVGAFRVLAGQDLSGMEGRLVVLTHDTGVPEVKLPVANGDLALYVVTEGGADGTLVTVEAVSPAKNYRVALKGGCNPGDNLVLADVATVADAGMVRVQPAAAGAWRVLAVAEEKGVDGQALLIRPAMVGLITVPGGA